LSLRQNCSVILIGLEHRRCSVTGNCSGACTLIFSHLDYCNCLCTGVTKSKLQKVQNYLPIVLANASNMSISHLYFVTVKTRSVKNLFQIGTQYIEVQPATVF